MRQLSVETLQIVRQLNELNSAGFLRRKLQNAQAICSLLDQLAARLEPDALACAFPYLFHLKNDVRLAARRTMDKLISVVTPYELLHMNEGLAWSSRWDAGKSWSRLAPSGLASVAGDFQEEGHVSILGLASCHHNGRVRHSAVRLLSQIADGSELPYLLIRQNDWVAPIAEDAQKAIRERLNDAYLPHLVHCLQLIVHLKELSRYDHGEIVRRTIGMLLDAKYDDALREAIHSPAREVRREIVRFGLEKKGSHVVRLVSLGLKSNDPTVRLACCRCLSENSEQEALLRILDTLTTDPFMPVRREASSMIATRFPDNAVDIWHRALRDSSFSIRDLGRFHLAKLGFVDTAPFYRSLVLEEPNSLAAIEGLAETGGIEDVNFFNRLMRHQWPTRRVVALRALARVRGLEAIEDMISALRDNSPSVVRTARMVLTPHKTSIAVQTIFDIVAESPDLFARMNALSLIAELGKWKSVSWLLRAVETTEPTTARFAEHLIRNWFTNNRVWTKPTNEERKAISMELERSCGKISAEILTFVRSDLARI